MKKKVGLDTTVRHCNQGLSHYLLLFSYSLRVVILSLERDLVVDQPLDEMVKLSIVT